MLAMAAPTATGFVRDVRRRHQDRVIAEATRFVLQSGIRELVLIAPIGGVEAIAALAHEVGVPVTVVDLALFLPGIRYAVDRVLALDAED